MIVVETIKDQIELVERHIQTCYHNHQEPVSALVTLQILSILKNMCRITDETLYGKFAMDISKAVTFLIAVLSSFAAKTPTKIDDAFLDLLTALQNSPQMLTWLANLLKRTPTVPPGTLPEVAVDESDSELQSAWHASPMLQLWGRRHGGGSSPDGTQPIGLGGLAALIKFLPLLLQLLPQIEKLMPQIQTILDWINGVLKPATPTT